MKKQRRKGRTSSAVELLDRMIGKSPATRRVVANATINARVSQLIYDARKEADMTQQQLAKLIGTTQSVIARLEDADYQGHSLNMLQRIATALNKHLQISFSEVKRAA